MKNTAKKALIMYFISVFLVFVFILNFLSNNSDVIIKEKKDMPTWTSKKSNASLQVTKNNYILNDEKECISNTREVYLTFDDGPTKNNTKQIIEILNQNNVKATFFIIGNLAERNPHVLQDLINNKMCVAPHTYSHNYKEIYVNSSSYMNDLEKCKSVIEKATKREVIPFVRIPGGMYNNFVSKGTINEIIDSLKRKKINYVEWNICSDDATGKTMSAYEIRDNIIRQSQRLGKNKVLVVLMHDSYYKKTTVEALPHIIKYFKEQGYDFKTFDNISPEDYRDLIKHNVINREFKLK